MGALTWVVVIAVILLALILYGYDDWKTSGVVFNNWIDKFTNPVYGAYDSIRSRFDGSAPKLTSFNATDSGALVTVEAGNTTYTGNITEV